MLRDVFALQLQQRGSRVGQAGGRHAPGADRGTDQLHRLRGLRQPLAKDEAVQRTEDQALGATGRARDGAHILRSQTVLTQVALCGGACIETQ